jgi:two-component system sensor histidine kinase DesK
MTPPTEPLSLGHLRWTEWQGRWFLVAMHVPFIAFIGGMASTGLGLVPAMHPTVALPLVLAAGVLQLRHSLAASRGVRPRHWPWTLLALVLVTYVPLPTSVVQWQTMQWFTIASAAMLLPHRLGALALVALAIGSGALQTVYDAATYDDVAISVRAWGFVYRSTILFM